MLNISAASSRFSGCEEQLNMTVRMFFVFFNSPASFHKMEEKKGKLTYMMMKLTIFTVDPIRSFEATSIPLKSININILQLAIVIGLE